MHIIFIKKIYKASIPIVLFIQPIYVQHIFYYNMRETYTVTATALSSNLTVAASCVASSMS